MSKYMMSISRHGIWAQLTVVIVIIWLYRLLPRHPCLHENITLSLGESCTNALISSGNFQNDNQIHEESKLSLFTLGIWCVSNPHGILVSSSSRCKISHKAVEVADIGTVFAGSNETVHRKSFNPLVLGFSTWMSQKECVTDVCTRILMTLLFLCSQKYCNPLNIQQYGKFNGYIIMQPLKIMIWKCSGHFVKLKINKIQYQILFIKHINICLYM